MGSSCPKQARACQCEVEESEGLPWDAYEAAKDGHPSRVIEYLDKGGNINASYKGNTMLHAACSNGRDNVLCTLLSKKKLCLNMRNRYNDTPLMLAAGGGYRDCVEILLVNNNKCTLETDCQNYYNQTALDIAHINNRQDVAFCMMSYLKNCPPPTGSKPKMEPRDENWAHAPFAPRTSDLSPPPTGTKPTSWK